MGGSDDPSNLAILTAEEHYVAHQLLIKIYPKNGKLLWAVRLMTAAREKQIRNNKEYAWIKKRISKYMTESRTGVKTGKQKVYHRVDPYLKALRIAPYFHLMPCYRYNPYRSAQEVMVSSTLLISFI